MSSLIWPPVATFGMIFTVVLSACVVGVGVLSQRPTSVFFFATKPYEGILNENGKGFKHLEGTLTVVMLKQQHYFISAYVRNSSKYCKVFMIHK